MKTINNEEEPLNILLKKNKNQNISNKKINTISSLRICWLISFISWIIFTFFTVGETSSVGMWISLSLMWAFLLLQYIFKK